MTKHTTRAPTHARRTLKVGVALPPDTSASANYTVRFFDIFFLEIKRQKILYNLPLSPAILLSLLSPPHSARVLHLETKTLWKECVLCTQCVYRPDSISWSSKLYLASSSFFFLFSFARSFIPSREEEVIQPTLLICTRGLLFFSLWLCVYLPISLLRHLPLVFLLLYMTDAGCGERARALIKCLCLFFFFFFFISPLHFIWA